jgi:hypothetical protein
MKSIALLGLTVGVMLFAAGCARNYTIVTNGGQTITSHGKPKYDRENSVFTYMDALGRPRTIPAGSVTQIAPSSETTNPTGFNAKPSR